jgi:hypothetical protein
MVNAWGDSFRAQEFYGKTFPDQPLSTVSRPSVLDNGFMKVAREVEDSEIELTLLGQEVVSAEVTPTETAPAPAEVVEQPQERSTKERVLKDGKSYNLSDINLDMLIKMGYADTEIGQVLKEVRREICK